MGITPEQFEQLKSRLGSRRKAAAASAPEPTRTSAPAEIILGIDPSLRGTGFGVIRGDRSQPVLLDMGTIKCRATLARSQCLAEIARTLRQVIAKHQPTVCAVEGLFFAQNLQTALIMGEARGAALAAVAESGIAIFEIAPRKVKQAIVGYGAAQKLAVAKMVQRFLNLSEPPAPDAADALALAITLAQENGRPRLTPLKRI